MTEPTTADELRTVSMGWIWAGVFVLVALLVGGFTPWEAISHLLENEGVGEEGVGLMAFVAGYTLPLTSGICALALAELLGKFRGVSPSAVLLICGGVLILAGLESAALGLSQLSNFAVVPVSGPPWVTIPARALQAYVNEYGWPLSISSVAIGTAFAIQIERWMHQATNAPG